MSVIRNWLSKREPWVFENSKVPLWLSKFSPIEIGAVNILCFVFYFLWGSLRHRSFVEGYRQNPFEKEAHDNQRKTTYLSKRPLWNWRNYR